MANVRVNSQPRAAGAADVQLLPLLGVQVQHARTAQQRRIQPQRAAQAGLLIHGEQQFQWRMHHIRVGHQRQRRGAANTVVRAQRGAVRAQPAVLDDQA